MNCNPSKLVSACVGLGLLCPIAAISDPGFYLKADAGGNITRDTSLREFFGPVVPGSKVKFDPGYRFGVAAGYEPTKWSAVEGEVGFMGNEIKSITEATRVDAAFGNVPFLLNFKLKGPDGWKIRPYIGGGAGGSASVIAVDHIDLNDTRLHGNEGDIVFAWQGFAGVNVALNDRMSVGLEYRYFHAGAPTWEADSARGTETDQMRFGRTETHAISATFNWRF